MAVTMDSVREKALQDYRKKLLEHKEVESRLKESKHNFVEIVNLIKIILTMYEKFITLYPHFLLISLSSYL